MMPLIYILFISFHCLVTFLRFQVYTQPVGWRKNNTKKPETGLGFRPRPKPPWVKQEVIRLKALMPDEGCRKIAASFNRLYKTTRQETVGKTYVGTVIRNYHYDIRILRNKIKHRKALITPKNRIWQIDLTGKPTDIKPRQTILGIIDHGCRACIGLITVPRKTSIRLLIHLLEAMDQYEKPEIIRTDNESVFCSRWFKLVLWLLNIKHQQTDKHCPWQNGRIERLFLTLKQKANQLAFTDADSLQVFLHNFRFWYNFVRPHNHLNGQVPAEVWAKRQFKANKAQWYEDETGLLRGYYLPPD